MMTMIENIDYVVCKICKKTFKSLPLHLKYKHNISTVEYIKRFPGSISYSEKLVKKIANNSSGEKNSGWKGGITKQKQVKRQQQFERGIKDIDYVVCKECNTKLLQITTNHLKVCSKTIRNIKQYKKIYPNLKTVCKKRLSNLRKLSVEQIKERACIGGIVMHSKNIHDIYIKYGDGSQPPLCKCGCGQPVKKQTYWPYKWNDYINTHHINTEHYKKNREQFYKNMKKQNPEKYFGDLKKLQDGAKQFHKNMKENNPKEYSEWQAENARKFHKKNPTFARENAKKIHMMHPDLGLRCYEGRLKNCPWPFMGTHFGSRQESDIAKIRFNLLGIVPIKGENCHVRISKNEFDFEQLGFIHEHHPQQQYEAFDRKEDYYSKRRKILDSNGHKNSQLIVTITVKEAENVYNWLVEKLTLNQEVV